MSYDVVSNRIIRLVEYILQPLTHDIKRASARSSHMCLLPYPLLPLHSMLRVAKLFPFGGGVIKHLFISTTLIPGVIGDCGLSLVCELFLNMYCSKVAKLFPSTVSHRAVPHRIATYLDKSTNLNDLYIIQDNLRQPIL